MKISLHIFSDLFLGGGGGNHKVENCQKVLKGVCIRHLIGLGCFLCILFVDFHLVFIGRDINFEFLKRRFFFSS